MVRWYVEEGRTAAPHVQLPPAQPVTGTMAAS
jgi:hypothetical protein